MGQGSVSISWNISVKRAPNQAFVRFRECMWLGKSPRYLIPKPQQQQRRRYEFLKITDNETTRTPQNERTRPRASPRER